MNRALGLIEVVGLTNAIIVADTMLKASNIKMEDVEITKGMGFVTVKVSGDVGAVKAAIDSGKVWQFHLTYLFHQKLYQDQLIVLTVFFI